jgi:ribosomal protein L37AE/L43A
MNCRHCQSVETRKDGRDRHSRQVWKCRDCGKRSSEGANPEDTGGGRKPRLWADNAERMREYRKRGKPEQDC